MDEDKKIEDAESVEAPKADTEEEAPKETPKEAPKETALEEKKPEIKNKAEALKKWFKSKPEEKKKKEPVAAKVKAPKESKTIVEKTPRDWRKLKMALAYTSAIVVLVASVAINMYLYTKVNNFQKMAQEKSDAMASQQNSDREKLNGLAAQIEKLTASIEASKNVSENSTVAASQPGSIAEAIKVAIYNGTSTVGLAKEMGETLKAKMTEANVVALDNAKRNNYTKTLVIAVNGKTQEAQKVAQAIGGQFSMLPLDETKPDADVLIVVGK